MRQQHHRRREPAAADVARLPRAVGQVGGQRGGQRAAAHRAARVVPAVRTHEDQRAVVGDARGRVGDDVDELGLGGEQPRPDGLVPRPAVDAEPAPLRRPAPARPGRRTNSTRPTRLARPAVERDRRGPVEPGSGQHEAVPRARVLDEEPVVGGRRRCPPAGRPQPRRRRRTAPAAAREPAPSRPPGGHHDTFAQQPAHQHDLVGLLHLRQATHCDGVSAQQRADGRPR